MGSPVAGVSPEYGAGLIDNTLASGKKSGYVFSYHGIDTKHSGTLDDYEVTACPERPNQSGVKCFFSDSTGVIRYSSSGSADNDSVPLECIVSPAPKPDVLATYRYGSSRALIP